MTKALRFSLLLVILVLSPLRPAMAERKVALLVGNSAYSAVPALRNPANDVALMARTLREAGFDVVETALDLDERSMRQTLRRFEDKADGADVGVVFYSGHGIEMNGQNYLVPVNARLASDGDVKDEAVPLDRVLETLDRVTRLKLVILDACRDNPFLAAMRRTERQRSIGRGLARTDPFSTGTLIAYAARAGTTASDGTGENSPFTLALAKYVAQPGLDIRLALGAVRDEVLAATGQKQEPFVYGSLGGSTLTLGPLASKQAGAAPDPAKAACTDASAHWAHAKDVDQLEFYEEHVRLFSSCAFAGFARRSIAEKQAAKGQEMASLPQAGPTPPGLSPGNPASPPVPQRAPTAAELARSVQFELQRVGCAPGKVDGAWNAATRAALTRFNTFAKTKVDTTAATTEALEALRSRDERVCPLACATGTRANGDQCVPIVCGAGQQLSARGICVAVPKSPARETPSAVADRNSGATQPSGQDRAGPWKDIYEAPQPGMTCKPYGAAAAGPSYPYRDTRYWCR